MIMIMAMMMMNKCSGVTRLNKCTHKEGCTIAYILITALRLYIKDMKGSKGRSCLHSPPLIKSHIIDALPPLTIGFLGVLSSVLLITCCYDDDDDDTVIGAANENLLAGGGGGGREEDTADESSGMDE